MQEQTPKRKKAKKTRQVKSYSSAPNNPYQQIQPKTNNLPGFAGSAY